MWWKYLVGRWGQKWCFGVTISFDGGVKSSIWLNILTAGGLICRDTYYYHSAYTTHYLYNYLNLECAISCRIYRIHAHHEIDMYSERWRDQVFWYWSFIANWLKDMIYKDTIRHYFDSIFLIYSIGSLCTSNQAAHGSNYPRYDILKYICEFEYFSTFGGWLIGILRKWVNNMWIYM